METCARARSASEDARIGVVQRDPIRQLLSTAATGPADASPRGQRDRERRQRSAIATLACRLHLGALGISGHVGVRDHRF